MASRPASAVWHGAPERKRGRVKGLEELADDTQGTAPVSSSRAAYVREFGGSWPPGWGEPGWQSFASPCARSRGGTANESVHSCYT